MKPLDVPKEFTPDAFAALEKTGISRRQFIARSGALIVGFSMAGLTTGLMAPGSAHAQRLDGAGDDQPENQRKRPTSTSKLPAESSTSVGAT